MIGDLPRGRGILGLLIREPQAIRMDELAAHPASVGFPAHHPPMTTFLGVPVRIRGTVFGNLYLTEKAGGGAVHRAGRAARRGAARAAGYVIENARAYGLSERRRQWLEASAELTETLQPPIELERGAPGHHRDGPRGLARPGDRAAQPGASRADGTATTPDEVQPSTVLAVSCDPQDAELVDAALARIALESYRPAPTRWPSRAMSWVRP